MQNGLKTIWVKNPSANSFNYCSNPLLSLVNHLKSVLLVHFQALKNSLTSAIGRSEELIPLSRSLVLVLLIILATLIN